MSGDTPRIARLGPPRHQQHVAHIDAGAQNAGRREFGHDTLRYDLIHGVPLEGMLRCEFV
jgi:hypothetical protein